MQLVTLVARGMTNKEIAAQLNLSEFTVKNYLWRIVKRVDAETRYACRHRNRCLLFKFSGLEFNGRALCRTDGRSLLNFSIERRAATPTIRRHSYGRANKPM